MKSKKKRPPQNGGLGERIRQLRGHLSQEAFGKLFDPPVTREAVSQWETNDTAPLRERLLELTKRFNCSYEWLATGVESVDYVLGVELRGDVAAGVWQESAISQDMELVRTPISPDPGYPREAQYALRVIGNSISRIAQAGSLLLCVDIGMAGITPRDGDLVVVERSRGALVETTVKRFRNGSKGPELWPESDDPKLQEKLVLAHPTDDVEVAIKGLVIFSGKAIPRGA